MSILFTHWMDLFFRKENIDEKLRQQYRHGLASRDHMACQHFTYLVYSTVE